MLTPTWKIELRGGAPAPLPDAQTHHQQAAIAPYDE
jgi:hypothetical protein